MSLIKRINDALPEDVKKNLKVLLSDVSAPVVPANPAPTAKFGEAQLQDGTTLKYDGDTLTVGASVTIVTPDGEIPAPDGDLVLADGTTVAVMGGKVAEISTPAEEASDAEPATAMSNDELKAKLEAITNELNSLKASFSAVKPNPEVEKLQNELSNLKAQFKSIVEVVAKIAEVPTADPIVPEVKVNKFATAVDEKANKLKSIFK